MLRVDCHFHPNFAFFLPEAVRRWQAKRIWKAFQKRKLDCVFISEHAYKHPARSFGTLERYRPNDATTVIIPAVEALTKEGIDVIVFSRDTHVYAQRDILTPFGLPIRKLIDRVRRDPRLHGVIPHPYAPSETGFLRFRTATELRKDERTLHFAEKYNGALQSLEALLVQLRLAHLLRRFNLRIRHTLTCPAQAVPAGIIALGGSDAHHLWDLGSCLRINAPKIRRSFDELFDVITSGGSGRSFSWESRGRFPLLTFFVDAMTALRERCIKGFHLYAVDLSQAE
ncbi:MAG: hypothetical protein WCS85_04045 [Candidatus Peribacteraceae bacterium]